VRVRVFHGADPVATVHSLGPLGSGDAELQWDGKARRARVPDGPYTARVEATTDLGTRKLSTPLVVDTRAPAVRVRSARSRHGRSILRVALSEAATLRVRIGSPAWTTTRLIRRMAGDSRLVLPGAVRVRLQPVDSAANVGSRVIARPQR
jgi:hypothetical protein